MYRKCQRRGRQPFLRVGNGPSQTLHVLCYFSPTSLLMHALCGCRVVSLMCIPIDTARYHLVTVGATSWNAVLGNLIIVRPLQSVLTLD